MKRHLGIAIGVAVWAAAIGAPAAAQQQITPPPPVPVTSARVTINNGPGDQTDPHVSGDLMAYTDVPSTSIRYYRFSTGVDQAIPSPPGANDSLSDLSGNKIEFTRGLAGCDSIMVFDVTSLTTTELAPTTCPQRFGASVGSATVAYIDFAIGPGAGVTFAADLSGGAATQLSSGAGSAQNPEISASGNVVVWEQCASLVNCDVTKSVRAGGVWGPPTLVAASSNNPDSDDTNIVYDSTRAGSLTGRDIYLQPAAGGAETQLQIAGEQSNPSISHGVIGFENRPGAGAPADIFVYVVATNTLYQVTNTPTIDDRLNDVSVLPNGDIRVVWASNDGLLGDYNVYATTFTPAGGDFTFDAIPGMSIAAGSSASANVNVNSVNGFNSAVLLSVTGQPAGVMASLAPNSVTPPGGNSASSVLNVSATSFVVPTNFTLTVTGASGSLSHSASANVTVTATATSTSNSIGDMLNAGCIDNAGIGNALTSKLSASQSAASVQTAINTLTALKNQIQAQAGKHIHTACTIGGLAFNPVSVLLLDVQALIDSLRVSVIPDPITGYVVNSSGVGVAGAAVSILDAGGNVVATATTDITGFYFFATMSVLTPSASYSVAVTALPIGFMTTTPPSPAFIWSGSGLMIGDFVLN